MQSPITGKEMSLKFELRKLDFRKESFDVAYHFFQCEETGEQFTTTEMDELNMIQLYNQYREKHKLPFPEEIKEIREKYGLAATKMAEILGFGINSYRNYESGEVPSQANARLIQLANDPEKFRDLVELSDALEGNAKERLVKKLEGLIDEQHENYFSLELQDYLLGDHVSDQYSGYRRPSIDKLTEMVVYFSERLSPFTTKLNKLLFYADFVSFKLYCQSMSGARYRAIDRGPVPNNFHSIFDFMANNGSININHVVFPNGNEGEEFRANPNRQFNRELFSDAEIKVLERVSSHFKEISTSDIIEYSHKEKAWIENAKDKKMISYKDYAFELSI